MNPGENELSLEQPVMVKKNVANLMDKLIRLHFLASTTFIIFCFVLHVLVWQYGAFPWPNLLLFGIVFITAIINPWISLGVLIFLLPFTANISDHLKALFNLEIFCLDLLSVDAAIGFLTGILFINFFRKEREFRSEEIGSKARTLAGLMIAFQVLIVITVAIAISRNLYQAASPYSIKGFFYNLANIRQTNWHDDYFPLKDLFVFTTAIALSIRLLTIVRTKSQLLQSVLLPLLGATVIILAYSLLSKITGIGYHRSLITIGVNSFFPDVHAYGGYALPAFLGGLYYLNSAKTSVKLAFGAFSLLAAAGVIVSGSRFSIVMLFLSFLFYVCFILIKRPRKNIVLLASIAVTAVAAVILLNYWGDRGLVRTLTLIPYTKSFEKLNIALSYRPEIFRSVLLMYSHYPILGLGKGIFNRESAIFAFSQSSFFAKLNPGENAHNYFLQILTETGIIGLSIFCAIFIYQARYLKNRYTEILTVLIVGIFLGNLYGHSLLIHNILVIQFILIGAANTEVKADQISLSIKQAHIPNKWRIIIAVTASILIISAIREVTTSYGKIPFQQQFFCYKAAYYSDKQTSGLFEEKYKVTGKSLKIGYTVSHPDIQRRPLTIDFSLEANSRYSNSYQRTIGLAGRYEEVFNISQLITGSDILVRVRTSRCFTPVNLGVSQDNRRLGIVIDGVVQNK